jgi:dTDP-4-amino-4,6-dideoxygalactose transaminase
MGPEVEAFEKEFAAIQGVRHAVAVANATAGLHLAFAALDLGPGDEVIQSAINFVAAANMTVAVGATPVFADICSLAEPTIDPSQLESLIGRNTKAVVVMHYGGHLCRMPSIVDVCKRHGLALIEDACHAVGARYLDPTSNIHQRMAGSIGDVGVFSFFSNKNLATGEGGMVVTDRDDLAERIRNLRSHGMTTLTWDRDRGHASSYQVIANGYNYRFDELHAALGRVQLAKLERNNMLRRQMRRFYEENLNALRDWIVPFANTVGDTSGHLMVVVAPTYEMRATVVHRLNDRRIQTSLHYPSIPEFRAFSRWRTTLVNCSREFSRRTITLPLFPAIKERDIEEICRVIREVCGNSADEK